MQITDQPQAGAGFIPTNTWYEMKMKNGKSLVFSRYYTKNNLIIGRLAGSIAKLDYFIQKDQVIELIELPMNDRWH